MKSSPTNMVVFGAVLVAMTPMSAVVANNHTPTSGNSRICAGAGLSMSTKKFNDILDNLPSESKKLLLFTQCFGGAFLDEAKDKPNVAASAAAKKDGTATYTGYDDASSKELKPAAGNNAKKVHDAGTANKKGEEDPKSTDGSPNNLPLNQFSLEPTSDTGDVYSRHIIIYAGDPELEDTRQRDRIKKAFAGQSRTSVRSVGGPEGMNNPFKGRDGWDYPGRDRGFSDAIRAVQLEIARSGNVDKEQVIIFVTDHGGKARTAAPQSAVPPQGKLTMEDVRLFNSVNSIDRGERDVSPRALINDAQNVPGFEIFIPFRQADGLMYSYDPLNYQPYFQPGDWSITLGGFTFTDFEENYGDLSLTGASVLGDEPTDGVGLFFPVDESLFVSQFFDVDLDVDINNEIPPNAGDRFREYFIEEFSQYTGDIRQVPEPSVAVLPALFLIAAATVRWRRKKHWCIGKSPSNEHHP